MKTFLQAIATEEGFYASGSLPNRPQRNNNPGDLEYNAETVRFGATKGDPRFAIFPTVAIGWKALQHWLSIPARFNASGNLVSGYLGAEIHQVIGRFAPDNENNTATYLASVCAQTGCQESDTLTTAMLQTPEIGE